MPQWAVQRRRRTQNPGTNFSMSFPCSTALRPRSELLPARATPMLAFERLLAAAPTTALAAAGVGAEVPSLTLHLESNRGFNQHFDYTVKEGHNSAFNWFQTNTLITL